MYHLRQSTSNIINTSTSKRYILAAALTLFTLWFLTAWSSHGGRGGGGSAASAGPFGHDGWMSRDEFVERALEKDIYVNEYDGKSIRRLCSEAKWREDRVVSCDEIAGGIGNLKTTLLACARYAIEAGAALVTPVIHPREAFGMMEDSFAWDTGLLISYMFDSDHFFGTLARDCPQLHIVDEKDKWVPPKSESHVVGPKKLIAAEYGHVLIEPERWRPALDRHVREEIIKKKGLPKPSRDHPLRIAFDGGVAFSWPVAADGDDFRQNWGHLARFPRHIRELSARALYNLYGKIGARQSPAAPSRGAFLGAHVRTEKDVQVYAWTSYEAQAANILAQLKANNLSVLYVATGTASDVDRLRADVADLQIPYNDTHTTGVQVFQKWDILDEDDLILMDTLTWDQMALVDLDIMLRSSRFVGIWESSWTWTISLRRHAWSTEDPYDYDTHPLTFEDEYSIIYGPTGAQPIIDPTFWL